MRLVEKIPPRFGLSTQMRFYLEVKEYRELNSFRLRKTGNELAFCEPLKMNLYCMECFLIKRGDTCNLNGYLCSCVLPKDFILLR